MSPEPKALRLFNKLICRTVKLLCGGTRFLFAVRTVLLKLSQNIGFSRPLRRIYFIAII